MGKPGPELYLTMKSVTLSLLKWPGTMELTVSEARNECCHRMDLISPSKANTVELNAAATMSMWPSPLRSVSTGGTIKPDVGHR